MKEGSRVAPGVLVSVSVSQTNVPWNLHQENRWCWSRRKMGFHGKINWWNAVFLIYLLGCHTIIRILITYLKCSCGLTTTHQYSVRHNFPELLRHHIFKVLHWQDSFWEELTFMILSVSWKLTKPLIFFSWQMTCLGRHVSHVSWCLQLIHFSVPLLSVRNGLLGRLYVKTMFCERERRLDPVSWVKPSGS